MRYIIVVGREATTSGWLDLPLKSQPQDLKDLKTTALRIKEHVEALVVIGIGGSYSGARAAIELLNHSFDNQLKFEHRGFPQIYWLGHTISPTYTAELLEVLAEKNFMINVISKSGTTTEPAIAFRLVANLLIKKYGFDGARRRIIVTTDRSRGVLKQLADKRATPSLYSRRCRWSIFVTDSSRFTADRHQRH